MFLIKSNNASFKDRLFFEVGELIYRLIEGKVYQVKHCHVRQGGECLETFGNIPGKHCHDQVERDIGDDGPIDWCWGKNQLSCDEGFDKICQQNQS